jgi:hypothetical protein
MTPQGRRWRRLGGLALLAGSLAGGGAGCLSFCHPVPPPSPEQAGPSACLADQARNHVHIFLIHGLDPFDFANLEGVRDYCQSLGYIKTHYGQLYHLWKFKDAVRQVHQEDPEARFVLIGFSFGANMVRELANAVKDDGVTIDLLVYLGGNTLENTPPNRPEHCLHIVNILATGCIWNGCALDGADNIHYTNVWHFGSPTHPGTLEVLSQQLAAVAARVPVVLPAVPPPLEDELHRPQPLRQTMPPAEAQGRDEWDFLKPGPEPELPMPRRENKFNRPSPVYKPAT